MPKFVTNTHRLDPYKTYKFRLKADGAYVAGLSKMSGMSRSTEVINHRVGGDPSTSRKSTGQTEYEAITLEHGVTHDQFFDIWANKIWNYDAGLGAEVSLKDFRKDLYLEIMNEAGQVSLGYKLYRCWPSEFKSFPDLDASASAIAIQTLKLENEGWERDWELPEPSEETFDVPAS